MWQCRWWWWWWSWSKNKQTHLNEPNANGWLVGLSTLCILFLPIDRSIYPPIDPSIGRSSRQAKGINTFTKYIKTNLLKASSRARRDEEIYGHHIDGLGIGIRIVGMGKELLHWSHRYVIYRFRFRVFFDGCPNPISVAALNSRLASPLHVTPAHWRNLLGGSLFVCYHQTTQTIWSPFNHFFPLYLLVNHSNLSPKIGKGKGFGTYFYVPHYVVKLWGFKVFKSCL